MLSSFIVQNIEKVIFLVFSPRNVEKINFFKLFASKIFKKFIVSDIQTTKYGRNQIFQSSNHEIWKK